MADFIIGTAGHIDHGKTALVKALTGIDTDRLPEEKKRGITIELGFAHFTLPSGKECSVIDVPGHERFVRQMSGGAFGFDLALLVISAEEGIRPQTKEHFDILLLLKIPRLVVVLTHRDRVDSEWLQVVEDEVRTFLAKTPYAKSPIVSCDSLSGAGIPQLITLLDQMLTTLKQFPSDEAPFFRLPIDRVFSLKGVGTVLTGTALSGSVQRGEEAWIYPAGKKVSVKEIEQHGKKISQSRGRERIALNIKEGQSRASLQNGQSNPLQQLKGHISRHPQHPSSSPRHPQRPQGASGISRGDIVVSPPLPQLATFLDARLQWVPSFDLWKTLDRRRNLTSPPMMGGERGEGEREKPLSLTLSHKGEREKAFSDKPTEKLIKPAAPLRALFCQFQFGLAAVNAKVSFPFPGSKDSPSYARISLATPLPLLRGDRFILRGFQPLPHYGFTIGGGRVLKMSASPRSARSGEAWLHEMQLLDSGSPEEVALFFIEEAGLSEMTKASLSFHLNCSIETTERILANLQERNGVLTVAQNSFTVNRNKEDNSPPLMGGRSPVGAPGTQGEGETPQMNTQSEFQTIQAFTPLPSLSHKGRGKIGVKDRLPALPRKAPQARGMGREAWFLATNIIKKAKEELIHSLLQFHKNSPLSPGIQLSLWRSTLNTVVEDDIWNFLLAQLSEVDRAVAIEDSLARHISFTPSASNEEARIQQKILSLIEGGGSAPPPLADLASVLGKRDSEIRSHLQFLSRAKRLIRVKDDLYYPPQKLAELREKLPLAADEANAITPQAFREVTGLSRKYLIPLLEYFDAQQVTYRTSNARYLRKSDIS